MTDESKNEGKSRSALLSVIDTKTKVMALICVVVEAMLLASLPQIDRHQRLYALIVCAVVLIILLIGMFVVEIAEARQKHNSSLPNTCVNIPNETSQLHTEDGSKQFLPVGKSRSATLTGKWTGKAHQEIGPGGRPIDFDIIVYLRAENDLIQGEAFLNHAIGGNEYNWRFDVCGGFLHGQFFQMEYNNSDPAYIQFGSMVFKLSSTGRSLEGKYVGYGSITNDIVYGKMDLVKQP